MDKLIRKLKKSESFSIVEVMAFMSYNPSIGRVLAAGGVKKFQKMAIKKTKGLKKIKDKRSFDLFHNRWVCEFIERIRTNNDCGCSYGQAQKAINVFLKLYIDWANLPDSEIREKLLSFLHVPLDSILMEKIIKTDPVFYEKDIKPLQKKYNWNLSLSRIDKEEYLRWQSFFREKHPEKPLLFDIVWATNR
jgi:hypothetical protein